VGRIYKDQKGFTLIEVLLIIIAITLISFAGWYVYSSQKKDEPSAKSSDQKPKTVAGEKSVALKTYSNDEYGFSIKYPESWKITEDFEDLGRDANEGDVVLLSPNDTTVKLNLNQGGKGGDCWDDQADARTTRTCQTLDILSVKKLSGGAKPVYFYEASVTAATRDGGAKEYFVYIDAGDDILKDKSSHLGMFGPMSKLVTRGGYVEIKVSGKDDDSKNSKQFLESQEVQEASSVLQSFNLL
jgi:PsbP-like protein